MNPVVALHHVVPSCFFRLHLHLLLPASLLPAGSRRQRALKDFCTCSDCVPCSISYSRISFLPFCLVCTRFGLNCFLLLFRSTKMLQLINRMCIFLSFYRMVYRGLATRVCCTARHVCGFSCLILKIASLQKNVDVRTAS